MSSVAVICGGAENVWQEIEQARGLCLSVGREPSFFALNDMIGVYPGQVVAVTLHPQKLERWLAARKDKQMPPPCQVWAHRFDRSKLVTHKADDHRGSVGLFGTMIARKEFAFKQIILCGVPMVPEANHFVRKFAWNTCLTFRRNWEPHIKSLAPFVRSFSGWTLQQFGPPSVDFVRAP